MATDPMLRARQLAVLRGCTLFRRLGEGELEALAALAEPITAGAGEVLFTRGRRAGFLYVVVNGIVRVEWTQMPVAFELSVASAGDVLGWSSLVEPFTYAATATAMTECELVRFDARETLDFLRVRTQAGYDVMSAIAALASARIEAIVAHVSGLPYPGTPPHS